MPLTRRSLLRSAVHAALAGGTVVSGAGSGAVVSGLAAGPRPAHAAGPLTRPIPSSGEQMPVVGLGSWITFNVGTDRKLLDECAAVMAAFFAAGGRMIDCSPMYASSQPTIGYGLRKLGYPPALFSAEKVWTGNIVSGSAQIERSRELWGVPRLDLVQVHNLLQWERHLETLFALKAAGRVRYVGVTTSDGRRHGELLRILESQPLDFVQVSYNVLDREAEARILPLARERKIAVIVNRPFREGRLLEQLQRHRLPPWYSETGARSWAQFVLKFIVSHPDVTCAIPATTRVDHLQENMAAGRGKMPDEALRYRMADYVAQL